MSLREETLEREMSEKLGVHVSSATKIERWKLNHYWGTTYAITVDLGRSFSEDETLALLDEEMEREFEWDESFDRVEEISSKINKNMAHEMEERVLSLLVDLYDSGMEEELRYIEFSTDPIVPSEEIMRLWLLRKFEEDAA